MGDTWADLDMKKRLNRLINPWHLTLTYDFNENPVLTFFDEISDPSYNIYSIDDEIYTLSGEKIPEGKANRENLYPNVEGKYMFIVSIKDIKPGDELTANYNLYTYPKTGVGLQTF